MPNQVVTVRCSFRSGGFPDERLFIIRTTTGATWYGVAPAQYCLTPDLRPLGDDPDPGVEMAGRVAGLALTPLSGETVRVYLPDSEVYELDATLVAPSRLPGRSGQEAQSASVMPPALPDRARQ